MAQKFLTHSKIDCGEHRRKSKTSLQIILKTSSIKTSQELILTRKFEGKVEIYLTGTIIVIN